MLHRQPFAKTLLTFALLVAMTASMDNNGSIADEGDSAEGQEEEDLDDIISIQVARTSGNV
jgi:hypothetical protein